MGFIDSELGFSCHFREEEGRRRIKSLQKQLVEAKKDKEEELQQRNEMIAHLKVRSKTRRAVWERSSFWKLTFSRCVCIISFSNWKRNRHGTGIVEAVPQSTGALS